MTVGSINTNRRYKMLQRVFAYREIVPFVLLIIVLIVSMSLSSSFRDLAYLLRTSTRYMELGMTALTMTLIITAGMIDLSVPAVMCCSATVTALLFHAGAPMGLTITLGMFTGAACGALNGVLIAYLNLPAMIVTIGTMNLFRGISQIFIGDKSLGSFPKWFNSFERKTLFTIGDANVGVTLLIFVLVSLFFYLMLHRTRFGRKVFAIGANEQAAIHSGVNTRRVKLGLFIMSGFVSAAMGILTMSRLLLVRYDMHLNSEIDVVIMVLLGGADINGGRGSIIGTVIAVVLVIILKTGLIVANITSDAQMFVMGLILLVSIIIPNISSLLQELKDK
ncbi:MAG: ABC transporter permease [Treponema sp.]|jgi:rhamnose transport system permease protein|nr:ABC transporter permease [Treponema sp.]